MAVSLSKVPLFLHLTSIDFPNVKSARTWDACLSVSWRTNDRRRRYIPDSEHTVSSFAPESPASRTMVAITVSAKGLRIPFFTLRMLSVIRERRDTYLHAYQSCSIKYPNWTYILQFQFTVLVLSFGSDSWVVSSTWRRRVTAFLGTRPMKVISISANVSVRIILRLRMGADLWE